MATTLEQLLAAIAAQNGGGPGLPAPAPSMPIPVRTTAPPNLGMPVEPQRDIPQAPLDQSIIRQYMSAAGPAPVAPERPGRVQRIANALMGFGAGFEGRGAEFLNQLNEPRRRYERDVADYRDRQGQLKLRGIDAAERDQERRTERAERLEDQQYARRLAAESRRLGLADDESRTRLAHSLEIERDAIRAARAERLELQREQRRREDDARSIAGRLSVGPGAAPPHIAKELGAYQANLIDELSPAAAKWRSAQVRRYEQLVGGAGGGGGGGRTGVSNAAMKAYNDFNSALQAVVAASQRGDVRAERQHRARLDRAYGGLSRFPGQIEAGIGTGGWPYAKLRNAAPAGAPGPQAQGKTITRAEMQALGITDAQAQAEGYTITQ